MNYNDKQLNLKAIFNIQAYLIKLLCAVTAVLSFFYFIGFDPQDHNLLEFVTIFSSIILVPGLILMFFRIPSYAKQQYILAEENMTAINSFMGYARKDLAYLDVKEILLSQTFFQKMFGLGSVFIATNAIDDCSGLDIINIKNSEEIYHEIRRRVAKAKELEKEKKNVKNNN